jgi:hypothetical protein
MQETQTQGKGMAEQLKQAQQNHDFKEEITNPAQSEGQNQEAAPSFPDITFNQEGKPEGGQNDVPVKKEPPTEIRLGSRVFGSQSELQGYLEQLEETKGRYQAVQAQFQPQQVQQQPEEDLEQIFWSDPKKYTEIVETRAISRMKEEMNRETKSKEIEDRFYRTNSDLAQAKTLVKAITAELASKNELAGLTEDAALSKIAQAARRELYALRGQKMPTEELASGPVRVAGSSSGAPVQSSVQAHKPKSFIEQMKSLHRKG